jgi:hypothetical protein
MLMPIRGFMMFDEEEAMTVSLEQDGSKYNIS